MSPKKRTEMIRINKDKPNKANLQKCRKRLQKNVDVLVQLAQLADAQDA
ncbi:MAG: hypothetical protein HQM11_18645 [SAR324 cluster bacterium]|nr:hypothetical protein [SAR324 cluster bacterium]